MKDRQTLIQLFYGFRNFLFFSFYPKNDVPLKASNGDQPLSPEPFYRIKPLEVGKLKMVEIYVDIFQANIHSHAAQRFARHAV